MTTFSRAAALVWPRGWGEWSGQTIDAIARTDEGLRFLDRVRDEVRLPALREAVAVYLDDPTIAKELRRALEARP